MSYFLSEGTAKALQFYADFQLLFSVRFHELKPTAADIAAFVELDKALKNIVLSEIEITDFERLKANCISKE